ncbi:GAF and ANTAR domain-containing protein [Saccharopolyspora sp. HNM0986]|uniref:GAF and ANTAR domain-containing protein n=1 Tax=Saccharopolyspora galaxeae TaxID=2781241 RepID=UPI00190D8B10|nr:GAF and ANTAR domain-containing protein [Saccharopolyspora sp. HNM0986]MBK0867891.1 GAF and ANTAR domain-containing protein [Saccharopolyspora sp. HNM0986]
MTGNRVGPVYARLADAARRGHEPLSNGVLCRMACPDLDVDGASVTVMAHARPDDRAASPGVLQEPVATSDRTSTRLEELHLTVGEGPSTEAFASACPVLVPDLADATGRWPGFVPAALAQNVGSVFAFPLQTASMLAGVLTVHRFRSQSLTPQALTEAHAFAEVAVELLHSDPAEPLTSETRPPAGPAAERDQVHQAVGMLAVRLGVGLQEASLRLRAHALTHELSLSELARQVLTGQATVPADSGGS